MMQIASLPMLHCSKFPRSYGEFFGFPLDVTHIPPYSKIIQSALETTGGATTGGV